MHVSIAHDHRERETSDEVQRRPRGNGDTERRCDVVIRRALVFVRGGNAEHLGEILDMEAPASEKRAFGAAGAGLAGAKAGSSLGRARTAPGRSAPSAGELVEVVAGADAPGVRPLHRVAQLVLGKLVGEELG